MKRAPDRPHSRGTLTQRQILLSGVLLIVGFGLWWYFEVIPHRPKAVPKQATPVLTLGNYDWDYCWVDNKENVNRCQIFNRNGEALYDEIFLRYEGQGPVPAMDLKIKHDQDGGGAQWIRLENGVILIPQSRYERIKEIVDRRRKPSN